MNIYKNAYMHYVASLATDSVNISIYFQEEEIKRCPHSYLSAHLCPLWHASSSSS